VKQLCGNPEAVASAYSLYDYVIAGDLGGDAAYEKLRDRARAHGMRLASDMVPNHMGIDSRWVIEHPDWFLALSESPFPSYRFEGPDLSSDGRVEIKIDDHYYDRSDAAVVFRRVDRWTGDTRFIYHGNDGTSFPWNDTAQLDYLNPAVREGVIQTILHVARRFPIIRFDAAMTLAKRHFQRLWFPEPGTGGAVPSRAEHGLTRAEFDAAMPVEFWREVVDRVAVEAPGTLLLAEAFWLMEGYFVRTLGMHRVYNSAFMNMLRDEENANYRRVIKNTLEFDPEVLKRYVNFMNNPDERTAVDQFGKGDKYFGICTLMATLPGLPMFGHGQVEGFTEKYGMEYRRAYQDEAPDPALVARHEREIAPLLHRRALFAEARDFRLYDFFTDEGWVNEDVFAHSNRDGDASALVVYHNRFASTRGWVRVSCAYADRTRDDRRLRQQSLGEAIGLSTDPAVYVRYRDAFTGLQYLQRSSALADKGLRLELDAYRCHVFLDWRQFRATADRPWVALADQLDGHGVPDLDEALRMLELAPVHAALRRLLDPELASALGTPGRRVSSEDDSKDAVAEAGQRARAFVLEGQRLGGGERPEASTDRLEAAIRGFEHRLQAALRLDEVEAQLESPWPREARAVLSTAGSAESAGPAIWGTILASCALEALGSVEDPSDVDGAVVQLFDALRLREPLARALEALGHEGEDQWRAAARVRATFAVEAAEADPGFGTHSLDVLHHPIDPDVAWLIGVHEHEGIRYFVKEPFEQLLWWTALRPLLALIARDDLEAVRTLAGQIAARASAAAASGYRLTGA
jgi:hypothetical protein